MDDRLKAALLLLASNAFMTAAWYGHLRFKKAPLIVAIVVSWGIGFRVLSAYQLKVLQEAITLLVFIVFASLWLGEGFQPKYLASFGLILVAVIVAFR
jgi:uncharacterized protein